MKFKSWVSITVFIIGTLFGFMVFLEPIYLNIIGLVGSALCVYLLTKYSKFTDDWRCK